MGKMSAKLLLCVAAMCGAGPAFGQSSASASLINFSYSLVDLDLTDGITPSITFADPGAGLSFASVNLRDWEGFQIAADAEQGAYAFAPVSARASLPTARGEAAMSGSLVSGLSLQSRYTINDFGGHLIEVENAVSSGAGFILSPMTSLILHADVALSAFVDIGASSTLQGSAFTGIYMDVTPGFDNDAPVLVAGRTLSATTGESLNDAATLALTVRNGGAVPVDNFLHMAIGGRGNLYSIPAVPEPSAWAMLLAGIGLLGYRAAKRV